MIHNAATIQTDLQRMKGRHMGRWGESFFSDDLACNVKADFDDAVGAEFAGASLEGANFGGSSAYGYFMKHGELPPQ